MNTAKRCLSALMLPILLSGCVAAVIPMVAAGVLGKKQVDKNQTRRPQPLVIATPAVVTNVVLPPSVSEAAPVGTPALAVPIAIDRVPSTEPSAFIRFALDQNARRIAGESLTSSLLVKNVDIFKPIFSPCDDRPLAIMIDLDASDGSSHLDAPISLSDGLEKLREAKVEIIWLSQRGESQRADVIAQMQSAGLPIGDNDVLMLSRGRTDRKQEQRLDASHVRCVVALLGDEKPDFDELFAFLRNPDDALALDPLWNNGWFITQTPSKMKEEANGLDPR